MDNSELYSKSTLALEGTITGQTTEVTWVKTGNIDSPYTFTTWALLTLSNWPLYVPVLQSIRVYHMGAFDKRFHQRHTCG